MGLGLYLSAFLKAKRIEAGLSVPDLADRLNRLDPQVVVDWELGHQPPPHFCFPKLIEVLSLNKDEILEAMVKDVQAALMRENRRD